MPDIFPEAEGKAFGMALYGTSQNHKDIVKDAGGLVPDILDHDIELATGRGSHTTAMINIMERGVRGYHDE